MKFEPLNEVFSHGGVFQLDVLDPQSVVNPLKYMRWRAFYRVPIDKNEFPPRQTNYRYVDGDTPADAVRLATQLCVAARLRGTMEA